MAEVRDSNFRDIPAARKKKAITYGIIAALAILIVPLLLAGMSAQNEWQSVEEYVMIYPSVFRNTMLSLARVWPAIIVLIGAGILAYAIGFGSQGEIDAALPDRWVIRQETTWTIILAIVGALIVLLGYFAIPSYAREFTHITVHKSQFHPDDANAAKYDKHFRHFKQDDPVYHEVFTRRKAAE